MSKELSKHHLEGVAHRWMSLWSGGGLDAFDALHHEEFVDHGGGARGGTREAFSQSIRDLYRAFPDFEAITEQLVVDTERCTVAVRWTATGTHGGELLGFPATGASIRFAGVEIIEIVGDRVVARWGEWDGLELRRQLVAASAASAAPRHVLTILATEDLERSVRFYEQAFGWPRGVSVPVYVEFLLPEGRRVGLYERRGFASNVGQVPAAAAAGEITATEVYFHCDDLAAAIARIAAAGARVLSGRAARDWGDEAAYFADPDGNVVVLARPLEPK